MSLVLCSIITDMTTTSTAAKPRQLPNFGNAMYHFAYPPLTELTGRAAASACGERNGGCTSIHLCLPVDADYRKCACPDSLLPFCREYCKSQVEV